MAFAADRDGVLLCTLCPHACRIGKGEFGRCRVRGNLNGELHLPYYGVISSAALDPIEKKPLYHFLPGTASYSVGFWGCNMRCPFCQNYTISQQARQSSTPGSGELVDAARESGAESISYTYSEPAVHPEFCLDTAEIARENGLANVMVTNGMLLPQPAKRVFAGMDAVNIDLKSFNAEYYRDALGGDLATVKAAIGIAAERCHLEVTTLIVPGENDSYTELDELFRFIASVDPAIPLHLSRYFPRYKFNAPATSVASLESAVEHAKSFLRFVYPGNAGAAEIDTRCIDCDTVLIRRDGYRVTILNTDDTVCDSCGASLPYKTKW